jgi:hypothetical protein
MTKRKPPKKSPAKKPARKKTVARKKPAALSDERTPKLRRNQLQKWRMLEAESRAAEAELGTCRLTLKILLDLSPETATAYDNTVRAQREHVARLTAASKYIDNVFGRWGLDPREHGIDEDTGEIRQLPVKEPG